MHLNALLIAESDPLVLQSFQELLSNRLPQIDIHVATSADETHRKLSQVRYSVSIVAPNLVEKNGSLRLFTVQNSSVLMPVIVTVTEGEVAAARKALLYRGAFDVITQPIDFIEALSSIRIALWQGRLLRMLTQPERALEQFKCHIEAHPQELKIRAIMENVVEYLEATLNAVRQGMRLAEPCGDQLFFDLAVSIQERTKDRALARLNRLAA